MVPADFYTMLRTQNGICRAVFDELMAKFVRYIVLLKIYTGGDWDQLGSRFCDALKYKQKIPLKSLNECHSNFFCVGDTQK